LDRETGKKDLFKEKNGLLASLTTVLLLEMEKYNRLIDVMKKSLLEIERAIGGYIVMSETLDSMYVALQNGKVPANWSSVGFLSLKPLGPWYSELQERVVMFRNWLVEGPPNAFWLSGFFFPQGFMTGCL
jgi:dynein heavy chain